MMIQLLALAVLGACGIMPDIKGTRPSAVHNLSSPTDKLTYELECPATSRSAGCADLHLMMTTDYKRSEADLCDTKKGCAERIGKAFIARLSLRYTAADTREVSLWCDAEPKKCSDPSIFEGWMAQSHNAHIIEAARQRKVAQEDEQRKRTAAAFAEALGKIGEGFKQRETTTCNSRPNGVGGFNTVCD